MEEIEKTGCVFVGVLVPDNLYSQKLTNPWVNPWFNGENVL